MPPSLSCHSPAGRNSPKTRAAFRVEIPGAAQPRLLRHSLLSGIPLSPVSLGRPAQRGAGTGSGSSPSKEHLLLSTKIINSASEFLTWQQSPRKPGRLPLGPRWHCPGVSPSRGACRERGRACPSATQGAGCAGGHPASRLLCNMSPGALSQVLGRSKPPSDEGLALSRLSRAECSFAVFGGVS